VVTQAKVKAIANKTASAVSNMTGTLNRANLLSAVALYEKLSNINKADKHPEMMYKATLAA
jgi:hypothetical protein